jgi:hypothetical protein
MHVSVFNFRRRSTANEPGRFQAERAATNEPRQNSEKGAQCDDAHDKPKEKPRKKREMHQ